MKKHIVFILFVGISCSIIAQEDIKLFDNYLGASYGTSLPIGDFQDHDMMNQDAGFAQRGQKIELYGGKYLFNYVSLTGTFRYQRFKLNSDDLISELNMQNPSESFSGDAGAWETYSLLIGGTYRFVVGSKLDFFPRLGVGPILVRSPEIAISSSNFNNMNFNHSSERSLGLGYEFGIGTSTPIGKRIILLPSFTFSGGLVTIKDVETTVNGTTEKRDFMPKIHAFNLGFSIAYRFN